MNAAPIPMPRSTSGSGDVREVVRAGREPAQPHHPDQRRHEPAGHQPRRCRRGARAAGRRAPSRTARASAAGRRGRPASALKPTSWRNWVRKKNMPNIAADEQDARDVGAGALAAREEAQRRDRLLGAPLDGDERGEQHDAGGERARAVTVSLQPSRRGADEAVDERGHAERRGERRRRGRSDRCGARSRQVSAARAQIRAMPIGTLMNRPQRQETQLGEHAAETRPTLPPAPETAL